MPVKIDPPWRLDPLQTIVRAKWGDQPIAFRTQSSVGTGENSTTEHVIYVLNSDGTVKWIHRDKRVWPRGIHNSFICGGPNGRIYQGYLASTFGEGGSTGQDFIRCFDSKGSKLWETMITGAPFGNPNSGPSVEVDPSGGVMSIAIRGATTNDTFVKLNKDGGITTSYSTPRQFTNAIRADPWGNFWTGHFSDSSLGRIRTRKYGPNLGQLLAFSESTETFNTGIGVDKDGNFFDAGGADFILRKYNKNGALIWSRPSGGTVFNSTDHLDVDSAGNCWVRSSQWSVKGFKPNGDFIQEITLGSDPNFGVGVFCQGESLVFRYLKNRLRKYVKEIDKEGKVIYVQKWDKAPMTGADADGTIFQLVHRWQPPPPKPPTPTPPPP